MKRKILNLSSQLGLSHQLLTYYDGLNDLTPVIDDLTVDIEYDATTDDRGVVVFPNAEQSILHAYRYAVLASAFKYRGFQPLIVLGSRRLPATIIEDPENMNDTAQVKIQEYKTKKLLEKFGFEWVLITDYWDMSSETGEYMDEYATREYSIDLSELAKASTRKLLKKYHIGEEAVLTDKFRRSGYILMKGYENIVEKYHPAILLGNDDKYNYGGIPLTVASDTGVHTYSTAAGWLKEALILSNITHQDSLPLFEDYETIEPYLRSELSDNQQQTISKIMSDRMNGENESMIIYSARSSERIDVPDNKSGVGIFTNLIWDASLETRDGPYPDVFQWLQQTVQKLGKQTDLDVIIKTHPAEERRGTNESVVEWTEEYIDLPPNTQVLPPDTTVNTYELLDELDAAIVYNSTVGLEAIYTGVPAITAGKTHYRDLGITIDPETQAEYLDHLSDISELRTTEEQMQRAARYLYFMFEIKHFPFPYVNHSENKLRSVSTEDIDENNTTFNKIVDACSKGEAVLND